MAFYEQEFIEIKREKAKMEIIGTMKCSVEQEDVQRYLASRKPKEKRRMGAFGVLTVLVWLLAALPAVAALFLTNAPNPRLGGGTLALTVIFALIAIICTMCYVRIASASRQTIAQTNPDSPEQLRAAAPDAVVWKQNRQWEICHAVKPMSHVFLRSLEPPVANPEALGALRAADLIVIGPGSMFTSILPNLLVPGVAEAINESHAQVVFVCPLADAQGETRGMDVAAYVRALARHGLDDRLDAIIVNRPRYGAGARTYLAHDANLNLNVYSVAYTAEMLDELHERGIEPYLRPLADEERATWHNPVALREVLIEVAGACPSRLR